MQNVITWIVDNKAVILGVALFASEALAMIPSVKANSIFQLVFGWLQSAQAPAEPPKV